MRYLSCELWLKLLLWLIMIILVDLPSKALSLKWSGWLSFRLKKWNFDVWRRWKSLLTTGVRVGGNPMARPKEWGDGGGTWGVVHWERKWRWTKVGRTWQTRQQSIRQTRKLERAYATRRVADWCGWFERGFPWPSFFFSRFLVLFMIF